MRRRLIVGSVLGLSIAGAYVLSIQPVAGSISSAPPAAPSTVDIGSAPRLEATVSTDPGTWLAVAGGSGGERLEVAIPGTVTLSAGTLAALNGRFCVPGGQAKEGVSGAAVGVPPIPGDGGTGAFPGRTSISVSYPSQASSGFVACYASGLSGGTAPDCSAPTAGAITQGYRIDEGGSVEMEISDAYVLRCIHCSAGGAPSGSTVVVSYIEMDCNQ